MTDFSHEQDELASAYIDGEVTTDERAKVEADPILLARVAELRSVRDTLAASTATPAAAERDAAVAAAVRSSSVVDIRAAVRGHRRLRVASIAAAVLVALGAAGVLLRAADRHPDKQFATVAGSIGPSTPATAPTPQHQATPGVNPANGSFSFSTVGRPQLGSFTDRSTLTAAAQSQVHGLARDQAKAATADGGTSGGGGGTAPTCLVPPPPDVVEETYAASAILEGRAVQIDVFTIADGSLTLVVTDAATCTQDFTQSV